MYLWNVGIDPEDFVISVDRLLILALFASKGELVSEARITHCKLPATNDFALPLSPGDCVAIMKWASSPNL